MIKIIPISIILFGSSIVFWRVYSEKIIYQPKYKTISKHKSIEIREYEKLKVITTTETLPYQQATNAGFRTLANYIFGNNQNNLSIPMTAPVITTFPNENSVDIAFIISNDYSINKLPAPISNNINFQELELGKVAVIKFGLWATSNKIQNMKEKLEHYLNKNSIQYSSKFFVAQYNSPWIIPPFRKNELIVSIK
tara:strand:+ start:236 stop:820 length:585 start_codon:yes stop_codon:yes gene_type:complete